MTCTIHYNYDFMPPAIVCPSLELFNGDIIYSTEFEANATIYTIGTEAIQTCNAGYTLAGSTVRVCEQVNENGMWSGIASFCQRKWLG